MNPIRTVLCPLDFSAPEQPEVQLGVEICRTFDARLVLEHNFDPRPPNFLSVTWMWSEEKESTEQEREVSAQLRLQEVLNKVPPTLRPEGKLTRGPVDEALLYLARELPADLMVMATHGRSNAEHQSLTERIIVASPCPVLTLPAGQEAQPFLGRDPSVSGSPVVVPIDFSSHALNGLQYAFELARWLPIHLHLLYVEADRDQDPSMAESLNRLRGLVPAALQDRVETHVGRGDPIVETVTLADREEARALVLGTHPKSALRRWFSGAHGCDLLHASHCPVWFVPAGVRVLSAR